MPEVGILFAVLATLGFTLAGLIYRKYTRPRGAASAQTPDLSVFAMNFMKAGVGFACFAAIFIATLANGQPAIARAAVIAGLAFSGFVGLTVGDYFLIRAYSRVGVARTQMIFRFQPLLLALSGALLFRQWLNPREWAAIACMIACVLLISFERMRYSAGRWDLGGVFDALLTVGLDAIGLLLTRWAFEMQPELTSLEANFWRASGSMLGFFTLFFAFAPLSKGRLSFKKILGEYRNLSGRALIALIGASALGAFVSLWLWLQAIARVNLATVTAIGGCGPVFSTLAESAFERQWPSRYALGALLLSLTGFYLLWMS